MKILIFGHGQLGTVYKEYFDKKPREWQAEFAEGVDICDLEAVRQALIQLKPEVVLNVAAQTNLDWCEVNQLECVRVNTLGADNVGRACQEAGIYLVHMSSGCIQESKTADEIHSEEDSPNPLSFYSWTKVWAENLLLDRQQGRGIGADIGKPLKILILRPRQLLSAKINPRNALAKMLTYNQFVDTPNSCTVIEDLLWATAELIKKNITGVYNVVNPGVTTPYEIVLLLKEIIKPEMKIELISKEELNKMTLAKRIDSVLSVKKLEALGIRLPEIRVRLREVIAELGENLKGSQGAEIMKKVEEETKLKLKQ